MGKAKRFKHNVPNSLIGMTFDEAKKYCLFEGYLLYYAEDNITFDRTYVITVQKIDYDGKILEAKYGY